MNELKISDLTKQSFVLSVLEGYLDNQLNNGNYEEFEQYSDISKEAFEYQVKLTKELIKTLKKIVNK